MKLYPSTNPHGLNLLPFVKNPTTGKPKRYQVITPALKYGTDKRGKAIKTYHDALKSGSNGWFIIYDTVAEKYTAEVYR